MIYVIWHDYDSTEVSRFEGKEMAECLIKDILNDDDKSLDAVIEGKDIEYKIVSNVDVVRL